MPTVTAPSVNWNSRYTLISIVPVSRLIFGLEYANCRLRRTYSSEEIAWKRVGLSWVTKLGRAMSSASLLAAMLSE